MPVAGFHMHDRALSPSGKLVTVEAIVSRKPEKLRVRYEDGTTRLFRASALRIVHADRKATP